MLYLKIARETLFHLHSYDHWTKTVPLESILTMKASY